MATYTLFSQTFGTNYANARVRILETGTGIPAIIMASSVSGILSSNGNTTTDANGTVSVYLDSSKNWTVYYNQFVLIPVNNTLALQASRSADQLSGTPSVTDISLGPGATFYLDSDPTSEFRINAGKTAYVNINSGGGGGGGTWGTITGAISSQTDLKTLTDTISAAAAAAQSTANTANTNATNAGTLASSASSTASTAAGNASTALSTATTAASNASTALTTANAAIPATQKGAANGVATLDGTGKIPVGQIPAGGGGSAAWGSVTGTLSAQTDLQNALNNKVSVVTNWTAASNTPTITSGTSNASFNAVVVTDSGIVTLGTPIDGIKAVRNGDVLIFNNNTNTWQRSAGPVGAPVPVSSALTLTDAHDDMPIICSSTPTLTVNTGLVAGFGTQIRGAYTTTGTATVTDRRTSTGDSFAWSCIVNTGTDTYDLVGSKF